MRSNPFNLFLIFIAICDMSLMASYFIFKQIEMCHPWFFSYTWILITYGYATLSVLFHSVSLWLTVNMAVLRYLVIKGSATSNPNMPRFNTYKAAGISILLAVLISLAGSAPNMLRYQIHDNGMVGVPKICTSPDSPYSKYYQSDDSVRAFVFIQPQFWSCSWERFSFWTAGIVLKVIPCVLLTIFMALLVRMLIEAKNRKHRLSHGSAMSTASSIKTKAHATMSSANKTTERTTTMLVLIVFVFLITELPQGIMVLKVGFDPPFKMAMQQIGDIIDLLSLLNSSVNFILYSTMSNLFRREFINAFRECCPWERILQRKKSNSIIIQQQRTNNLARNGSAPLQPPLTNAGTTSAAIGPHTGSLKNQILRSPGISTKIDGDNCKERLIDVTSSEEIGVESIANV
jgi:hypothetical protein